jgi:hypothetical protein
MSKNRKQWVEIASADDDVIAGIVLEWSGHLQLWDQHELDEEHDFVNDVLDLCVHASVDREEWDADFPGRSGVWHTVSTDDADALKAEIRTAIERLIAERS